MLIIAISILYTLAVLSNFVESENCHVLKSRRLLSVTNDEYKHVDFIVALSVPNQDDIHNHLLDISDPHSINYGRYLSLDEIKSKYGPKIHAVEQVSSFFESNLPTSIVEVSKSGDMMKVSASVEDIETVFQTELNINECLSSDYIQNDELSKQPASSRSLSTTTTTHTERRNLEEEISDKNANGNNKHRKFSIRSNTPLVIPVNLQQHIAFISLDLSVAYVAPKGKSHLEQMERKERSSRNGVQSIKSVSSSSGTSISATIDHSDANNNADSHHHHTERQTSTSASQVAYTTPMVFNASVTTGNEEAVIRFNIICGDGSYNQMNPPCANLEAQYIPRIVAKVTQHAEVKANPFQLTSLPIQFDLTNDNVFCYNFISGFACSGIDGRNCTCVTKLAPLPKYTQLRANIYACTDSNDFTPMNALIARSSLFALTDVATLPFLSQLYNMPVGMTVRHGSTQAIAEFYGEFYSNTDLRSFLELSGLPTQAVPDSAVSGDNPNNELNPGGEAQLDLEYIVGMAPKAKTTFYSFSDRNPYSFENEGFLAFLFVIGGEKNPPSVLSMSYGDIEASVFNVTRKGSFEYGKRCDVEFMKLGLRGVSVIFSSGDDGVGNTIMRKDKERGCSKTWPSWPASSPYVTTVGATQMTDKTIPLCNRMYSPWLYGNNELTSIVAKCTTVGETVCSAANGCVITSGGGFSEVYDRNNYAPWQSNAVDSYLLRPNFVWSSSTHAGPYPNMGEMDDDGGGDGDRRRRILKQQLVENNQKQREIERKQLQIIEQIGKKIKTQINHQKRAQQATSTATASTDTAATAIRRQTGQIIDYTWGDFFGNAAANTANAGASASAGEAGTAAILGNTAVGSGDNGENTDSKDNAAGGGNGDKNKDTDAAKVPLRNSFLHFNTQGRAFPDISAYGSNFFVVLNGRIIRESGTSASAPVIAAIVTLWNDMRLANGLPTMGFLNPMLYAVAKLTPEAYHDITTGNNACAVGRSLETAPCCDHAFNSAPGWDATTGLGTINYGVFANLIINNHTFFPALAAYSHLPADSQSQSQQQAGNGADSSGSNSDSDGKDNSDKKVAHPLSTNAQQHNTLLNLSMTALCLSIVSIVLWFCQVFKAWKKIEYMGIGANNNNSNTYGSNGNNSNHNENMEYNRSRINGNGDDCGSNGSSMTVATSSAGSSFVEMSHHQSPSLSLSRSPTLTNGGSGNSYIRRSNSTNGNSSSSNKGNSQYGSYQQVQSAEAY